MREYRSARAEAIFGETLCQTTLPRLMPLSLPLSLPYAKNYRYPTYQFSMFFSAGYNIMLQLLCIIFLHFYVIIVIAIVIYIIIQCQCIFLNSFLCYSLVYFGYTVVNGIGYTLFPCHPILHLIKHLLYCLS